MDNPPVPLTPAEVKALREKTARGEIPSIEEVRRYVAATRVSYLSAEKKGKPRSRDKKPPPTDERQIDFF